MAAQQSLRHAFLTLAGLDGRLLDPTEPLQVSGLRSGDSSTAVAEKLKGTATKGALALWCVGGNRIVTWGRSIKEATVRWSKISSRTFSRSIQQSVRLLQFWQMAALWRGAIPAGVATAPESLTNWGMFSRSMLQALPLLQSWQMEALWRGEIRTGVTTAPVSVTNWGMFSRSMLQSARLLQFWQMAALWRGAIPTGGGTAAQSEISSNICSKLWHYFCCEQVAACYVLVPRCAPSHSVEVALQEERRMVLRVSWVFALNRRDQFIYADAFKPPTGGRPWLAVRSVFFT